MPDSPAEPRRPRPGDLAVAMILAAWVVAVARTEHAPAPTPPVVSYATAPR